jgi:hypothetical protein
MRRNTRFSVCRKIVRENISVDISEKQKVWKNTRILCAKNHQQIKKKNEINIKEILIKKL